MTETRESHLKMERFNESQMLELAKIYRDYECLWDVNNPGYKNRSIRERAYEEIAQKLNIPGVTARGVPKKIKNLRSSYHQEIKKINKSLSDDEKGRVYTPKVSWFAVADEVLSATSSKQESFSNNDDNSRNSDDESETNYPLEHIKMEQVSNVSDEEIEDYNMTEIDHTAKYRESEKLSAETSSSRLATPYKKPLKYKDNLNKRDNDLNKAIDKIDKIADRIGGGSKLFREKEDDEFDVFGKYIAIVLRSLPGDLAVQAKLNLQKTLSDTQLSAMRRDS